jgi:hydrogenase maturation protease
MNTPRILVAGIGNIFLGDDGFGSEVARRLMDRPRPENVTVADFGIRGMDLAYALLDEYHATILIDAVSRDGPPGALYMIEPDSTVPAAETPDGHTMNPVAVLAIARSMGADLHRVVIVGCEPATFGPEDGHMGLSAPVAAAVDGAVEMVEQLVRRLLLRPVEPLECSHARKGVVQSLAKVKAP